MAGIARTTQAIFSTTGLTPTAGFGAAANGTTTTEAGSSNTPANIQTGTSGAWAGGWNSATLGSSKFPAEEDLNAVLNVITSQLAYVLERGVPEYDTGTTYNSYDVVRNSGSYDLFGSKTDANTGNALPAAPASNSSWLYLGNLAALAATNLFTGGTTTGSANAQVLASLSPATGFSLSNNGATIAFTVGYTNTGTTTLAITSPSIPATAVKKDSGAGLINLTAGDLVTGNTAFVTVNTAASCLVLVDGPPLGTCAPLNVGTNLISSGGSLNNGNLRATLAGNANYYVATTGNDSNPGTSGSPWLTLQHAANYILQNIDLAGFTATVNIADGTYAGGISLTQPWVGGSPASVIFNGDAGTPSNVVISTSGDAVSASVPGAGCTLQNMKVTSSGGNCIIAKNGAQIICGAGIILGSCGSSSAQLNAESSAIINMTSNYSITGGGGYAWYLQFNGSIVTNGLTVTITGTPAYGTSFVYSSNCATVSCGSMTFSGSATGTRYSAAANAVVNTNGGGSTYLPGNVAGSTSGGGQYL